MDLHLKGKIALVTGSAHGLGKSIVHSFLQEGAIVVITDINKQRVHNTIAEFSGVFDKNIIHSYFGDLTTNNGIQKCTDSVLSKWGRIDVLVANLGSGKGTSNWDVSDEDWDKMMAINFDGARKITNTVVPSMIKNDGGSVIYISSIAGKEVIGAPIHYSVAKSALIAYSKNLSRKLAKHKIRTNIVCPGNIYFKEGTWDFKMRENEKSVIEMLDKSVPLKRFASPEEIADLVVFLSSDKAAFMTGSCIIADGGQTTTIS